MQIFRLFLLVFSALAAVGITACAPPAPSTVPAAPAPLSEWQVVDLTQPLFPGMPIWPGDPEFEADAWATYAEDYYFINRIAIGEHSGTHWGTPNTFIEGARSAEQIPAEELVMPAAVIDIRDKAAEDADYRLSVDDVSAWEAEWGRIPDGSAVLLLTGWQDKWGDADAYIGLDADGVMHWPGFGADTVEFMIFKRGIVAIGTDTHGADPGNDEEFGASFAMYDADGAILEGLANLDKIPPVGATLVVGGWPIVGGSGSPARVLAFIPPSQ